MFCYFFLAIVREKDSSNLKTATKTSLHPSTYVCTKVCVGSRGRERWDLIGSDVIPSQIRCSCSMLPYLCNKLINYILWTTKGMQLCNGSYLCVTHFQGVPLTMWLFFHTVQTHAVYNWTVILSTMFFTLCMCIYDGLNKSCC